MPRRKQLCSAVALCKEQAVRYYLLGNGSNILFADEGFSGAVMDVSAMKTGIGMRELWKSARCSLLQRDRRGGMCFGSVQVCTEARLHRVGICLWHPRHGGRCGLYECRCLRRRDEGCADPVQYLAAGGNIEKCLPQSWIFATATAFLKRTAAASSRRSSPAARKRERTSVPRWTN